ncbi:MAG TPA: Lrp/AsnC family transcriptional regulator [Paenirhodobacter sp.]
MNDHQITFDIIDLRMLEALARDGSLSQRALAEIVGLSQNACWRRLTRLQQIGVLRGTRAMIDLSALGLDLTVFAMIRTRHHSDDWSRRFRLHVESLPEVGDFFRIGGEWDYMIKAVTAGMAGYDRFYQRLIKGFELERVTGYFVMETIVGDRAPQMLPERR